MKILAIRGMNIASLEGEFEIDFAAEPLASANIFAISGPTGAGKSSLLDTMCLALFAKTPRTDQAKEMNVRLKDVSDDALVQSDPRFLLRRGTATGYAETDFVALNGHRYRARWSVSRAREKEDGRLQNPRLSLFNIDKDTEEQGTRSELQLRIIELIGLTFEQFTRSVLLAQNDFSTFLKAEQGDKAVLLEKLTGTELYSVISKRIYEKNSVAKAAFDVIRNQIGNVLLLTDEEEEALRKQAKDAGEFLQQAEQAKKEWNALSDLVTNTARQLQGKQADEKEAEERLSKSILLKEKTQSALETETKATSSLEETLKALQPQLQEARKLDVELTNAGNQLNEHKTRLTGAEAKLGEAQKRLKAISDAHHKGEEEKNGIKAWFTKYHEKEKIAGQLPTLLLHLDAAERVHVAFTKNKQEEAKLINETKELAENEVKSGKLLTLKQGESKTLNENYNKLDKELKEVDTVAIEQEKAQTLKEREALLQEQLIFSSAGSSAKELRDKLTDGIPCPVCGSLEHPYASKEVHTRMQTTQNQIIKLTEANNTFDKKLKEVKEKREQLDKLRELLFSTNKEVAEIEKRQTEFRNRIQMLDNKQQQIKEWKEEHQQELERATKATDSLFGNEQWQAGWLSNPLAFRQTLTDFVSEWQGKEKRSQELEQTLSGLKSELTSYTDFSATLDKEVTVAREGFNKQNTLYTNLKGKRVSLLGGKSPDTVEEEYRIQMEQKKKLTEQLRLTLTEQAGIAAQATGQKEQIAKDLISLGTTLTDSKTKQEEWLKAYHESSEGMMPEERWTKLLEEKTGFDFRLQTQTTNKKQVAKLKEEAERKQAVSEEWAKLNELAGSADGAKFRRIAQSYTLDLLLNYANIQLRSLTNRYRLERVPDTLALQVIDRDMCDEIRTVHSLSGGESFLVSLALALGLSSLSSNRMKVESLFIDEGFGSLDSETLRMAMDALENLRTQGRKIGVISHVQEMTERIPVQIRINRQGSGKSSIEII